MHFKNSLNFINEFLYSSINQIRKLYLRSSIYNNKISRIEIRNINYKPSLTILSCLIKYKKKKLKLRNLIKITFGRIVNQIIINIVS